MKARKILLLVCTLCLLICHAQAETTVTFEDMHYGDEAFQMHLRDEVNKLIFQGEEYLLEDDRFNFMEAMMVYGGKTRAVYEMTLPTGQFSVTPDGNALIIGAVEIDIPYKATLWVGTGNRRSGVYTLSEPITLTDVYQEHIYLPRDAQGAPVLIDQVYLYSYEVNGEVRRYAATLYIDYEGYHAAHAGDDIVYVITDELPVAELPLEDDQPTVPIIPALAAAVIVAVLAVILLRRRKPAEPAKLPEAPAAFTDQAEELLRQIQEEADLITDQAVCTQADALLRVCRRIIKAAAEQPTREQQCRRLLNYYLPTALRTLTTFRKISRSGVSAEKVDEVRSSTLKGLDMILEACQKLLDNLYKGEMLDATLDVEILEKMLKQDGLIENELDLPKVIPPDTKQE